MSYYTGDAYEGKFMGSVIIAGVLYYNRYSESLTDLFFNTVPKNVQEVVAVDLHTGKELWVQNWNNTRLSFGQILQWNTGNGHGDYSFLWATSGGVFSPLTWNAYDPLKGTWAYGLTNVPSGPMTYGPNGELLIYSVANGRLLRWNSTWAVKYYDQNLLTFFAPYAPESFISGHSDLIGTVMDASHGYDLNVSVGNFAGSVVATLVNGSANDRIIGASIGQTQSTVWGLSLVQGHEGALLFNTTWNSPSDWYADNKTISWAAFSEPDLVGVLWSAEVRQQYGVSLETGQLIWGPTLSQSYLDHYEGTEYTSHYIAYGKLYDCGVGGTLYCFDVQTGTPLWNYSAVDTKIEFKTGSNWWLGISFISDGKLYVGHTEHSANNPLPRGAPFICFNATTGSIIWEIDGAFRQTGWGGEAIIGDSIIATMDTYDQQIYAIGKGPTDTTITAPNIGVTTSTPITITGTVMDVSPGTSQDAIKLRFPDGVPAVSDASQSDWMLYVYKQFAAPTSATGVPVTISVIDSNNNFRIIGTATTNALGTYGLTWTPDILGNFTVIASFAGSNAYNPSTAETYFYASSPQVTPTSTTQTNLATSDIVNNLVIYLVVGVIAIIVAIAIGFALVLRKRP